MATSVNGKITKGKSDSDWVDEEDWKWFYKTITDSKVTVMGSETYKQFTEFPQKGALNVVVTKKKYLLSKKINGALFINKSPKEIIKKLTKDGFKQIALVGGEKLNASFIKEDLVDEIYIDIHPYLIGEGLGLFSKIKSMFRKLKLLEVQKLEHDLILLHYAVLK